LSIVFSEYALRGGEQALVKRLGLDIPALVPVQAGQIAQNQECLRMLWAQNTLIGSKRTLTQLLG
jgi:hypothetical protein